jgi:hypothetical protein
MKTFSLILTLLCLIASQAIAQANNTWTTQDRQYLLDNLTRSRDLLIKETQNLTPQQWTFKEAADRWSISEVVEHINIYELLWQRELNMALASTAKPDESATTKADSVYVGYIMEETPHVTTNFTKPFTWSVPMGLNEGKNNVAWFLKMRNESIDFVKTTTQDLRAFSLKAGRPNLHQLYIYVFGHTDRHLRQILKVKQHQNYPR